MKNSVQNLLLENLSFKDLILKTFKLMHKRSQNSQFLIRQTKYFLENHFQRLGYLILRTPQDETVGASTLS